MAKITREMKTAGRDIKSGKKSAALKTLKSAEKKNVKLTKIDREILIYNDTVAIYQTKGDELYGVEIVDASLAEQQRQLFELVWMQADRPANSRDPRTSVF